MPIPSLVQTIRDPGLGVTGSGQSVLCIMGTCSAGTANSAQVITSPAAAVDTFGQGPLVQDVAYLIAQAGGPVVAIKLASSVPAANGSVTATRTGTSTGTVTVAGNATDSYEVQVSVVATGGVGVGLFQYSLDGGKTFSDILTIPTGGSYVVPNSGLTLTFVPGAGPTTFERGDVHRFTTTAASFGATDVANGIAALVAYMSTAPDVLVEGVALSGVFATASAAVTVGAALETQLNSLAASYRYMFGLLDAGSADTSGNVLTAFASVTALRCSYWYGQAYVASGAPFAGLGAPKGNIVKLAAARAATVAISTDLARVASGPLPGVISITWDEFVQNTMDNARISTLRTWPMRVGYFITNARIKCPTGSDYRYLQHRRVMDQACRTSALAQLNFNSSGLLTTKTGTIDESEAQRVEAVVSSALRDALSLPRNDEGRAGHVSDFEYVVDRTINILTTETMATRVAVRPLGYAKFITTELGFSANVDSST